MAEQENNLPPSGISVMRINCEAAVVKENEECFLHKKWNERCWSN